MNTLILLKNKHMIFHTNQLPLEVHEMLDTKILVIDNDLAMCELLKNYFEKEGYEIKTVNDGA